MDCIDKLAMDFDTDFFVEAFESIPKPMQAFEDALLNHLQDACHMSDALLERIVNLQYAPRASAEAEAEMLKRYEQRAEAEAEKRQQENADARAYHKYVLGW